jgi:hypothetical protein
VRRIIEDTIAGPATKPMLSGAGPGRRSGLSVQAFGGGGLPHRERAADTGMLGAGKCIEIRAIALSLKPLASDIQGKQRRNGGCIAIRDKM